MATTYYAPDPIQSMQFIPGGIVPANGGQLFFYAAGTSTKTTVYKDNAAAVAWSNPIVLDSGGNLPSGGEVWFQSGVTYKVVFAPSNDTDPPTSPYWTKDNLSGMNDVSGSLTALEWVVGAVPTFVSATSFTLSGDQTATFVAGRRIKSTNTAGTIYSTITSVGFSAGTTTVSVVSDSGSLDSGLSAVSYGLLSPANPSIDSQFIYRKATAVASAGNGTTNIWGTAGDYLHVTGTNTINNFSSAAYAGDAKTIIFDGVLSLNSSASISIPFGNVTTAANDRATVRAETVSTATITMYSRALGIPLSVSGPVSSTLVFAGPSTGAAATPAFRSLVGAESAMVLLLSTTVAAASAAATVDFNLTSQFNSYVVDFLDVTANNNGTAVFVRVGNGGVYDTGANYDCNRIFVSDAGSLTGSATTATAVVIADNVGNGVQKSISGQLRFFDPISGVSNKKIQFYGYAEASGGTNGIMAFGRWISSATYNNLRILMSAGNISTGTFNLYGILRT